MTKKKSNELHWQLVHNSRVGELYQTAHTEFGVYGLRALDAIRSAAELSGEVAPILTGGTHAQAEEAAERDYARRLAEHARWREIYDKALVAVITKTGLAPKHAAEHARQLADAGVAAERASIAAKYNG